MRRRLLLSLLMCGLLFSCNGRNNSKNVETLDNEPADSSSFEVDEQGLAFYPLDDGTYGVGIGNAIYLSNIIVPSTHSGRNVTKVIKHGFGGELIVVDYDPIVKTITLPETIKEIEEGGFEYLQHLESIKLPKSLKKICDYGLDGISSLKEIQYNGTADEFNQIEFGKEWLETEYYNEGVELSFVFKDKTLALNSLFDQLVLFNYSYVDEDAKVIKVIDIQFRDTNSRTVWCFVKTSIFGHLYKRAINATINIENPDIAYVVYDSYDYSAREYSFSLKSKSIIGSTKINFSYENLTASITFNVTPDIEITVVEISNLIEEFALNRNLFYEYDNYYYCLDAFVTNIIDSSTFYSSYRYEVSIKDSLDSDVAIQLIITCTTEISESSKIHLEGCRFDYNYEDNSYVYNFRCDYTVTIL